MTMLTPNFAQNSLSEENQSNFVPDANTELLRAHAKALLAAALEAEVTAVIAELKSNGTDVVRNGYLPERKITCAVGDVEVKVPRIRSKEGEPVNFTSTLVPKYLRRSKSVSAWAAYAYLKGVSEADMAKVLEVVLGDGAKKLTPSVVSSLKKQWVAEFDTWKKRDLSGTIFTYIYADGIYQEIRGDNPKICVLVIIGVDDRGKKHLIALEDGVRESTQSWREVLLDLKSRGMNSPSLAVGDGALGFWAAISEVFPDTKGQRCWFHKSGNIINYLPKSLHSKARSDIQAIWMAPSRSEAEKAIVLFRDKYQDKYEKAVRCLTKDQDSLLRFYDFPASHWIHIRTTNAIESTFSTLRHRTIRVKGAFSKESAMSMMFQLGLEAEKSWRKITGSERLAQVISGVRFIDGEPEELAS